MVKQQRKPHRFKKRKPIYRNRFFWLGILIVISCLSLFYFLFLADFFQVKKINVAGSQRFSKEQLDLSIKEKLETKILFLSTKSIFGANLGKIKEDILKRFPQIAEIEIHRNFPDNLNVLVTERTKVATFCKEDSCFALDKEGIIFEKAVDEGSAPQIRDFVFSGEMKLGEEVIEKGDLISILEINYQLKENLNIPVKEFIISTTEKLIVRTHEGWEIYFNLKSDVKWQLMKLKVLLEEKIPQDRRKDLEWIELRFGNFANPKYKTIQQDI